MYTLFFILTGTIIFLIIYSGYLKLKIERDKKIYLHSIEQNNKSYNELEDRYNNFSKRIDIHCNNLCAELIKEREKNKFLSDQNIFLHSLVSHNDNKKYFEGSEILNKIHEIKDERLTDAYNKFQDILQFSKEV